MIQIRSLHSKSLFIRSLNIRLLLIRSYLLHLQVSYEYVQGSVPYRPPWSSLSNFAQSGLSTRKPSSNLEDATSLHLARLYPNVRGCGYPPELNCEEFFQKFGGSRNETLPSANPFPCWVSTVDTSIAMTELDLVRLKFKYVIAGANSRI